jgi:hypothetical protein
MKLRTRNSLSGTTKATKAAIDIQEILAPCPFKDFLQMWHQLETISVVNIEHSPEIRSANSKLRKGTSDVQTRAQYGRILPLAANVRIR